jgi:speckle-type POZ protein
MLKSVFFPETEQGAHVFEITWYSLHRGLGVGRFLRSGTFAVGGHDWSVLLYPDGADECRSDCISVGVELMSASRGHGAGAGDLVAHSLCFFHRVTRMFSLSSPPAKFTFGYPTTSWRHCFCSIRRIRLESCGYAAGNRVMVKCVVAVVKDPGIPPGAQVPPSDITEHLRSLLESKECTDVTFEVEGQDFPAHRLILADWRCGRLSPRQSSAG